MKFDILDIPEKELDKLSVVQMKMLRTAQQKKDELIRKAGKQFALFKGAALSCGMKSSSLIASQKEEIDGELAFQLAVLTDNLVYNMSLNEPTYGGDLGESGGNEGEGYLVDYSLSYSERYVLVRDYYLSIENAEERMALYSADETAKKYLSGYYSTLYNVLSTYSR